MMTTRIGSQGGYAMGTSSAGSSANSPPNPEPLPGDARRLDLQEAAAAYEGQFATQLDPQNALAQFFIRQMGRFAAGADFYAAAFEAAVRYTGESAEAAPIFPQATSEDRPYLVALASKQVATASRSLTRLHRSLSAAMREYRSLVDKGEQERTGSIMNDLVGKLFVDERACEAYLEAWQLAQPWVCPSCQGRERYALQTRAVLECCCKKQYSIRDSTILEGSHVPLLAWFRLITGVLSAPLVSTSQLSSAIGISRHATVRRMQTSVQDALKSPDAERRLAGLPSYVLAYLRQMSYPDANSLQPSAAASGAPPLPITPAELRS